MNTSVDSRFQPVLDHLRDELRGIRTGRATASLIEHVKVDLYGATMDIQDVAGITVADAQTLQVEPYDGSAVPNIVKGIEASGLGVMPSVSGTVIRLVFPPLTTERRTELARIVRKSAEEAKISLRNIREREMRALKQQNDEKDLSDDALEREKKDLQKKVDEAQNMIDRIAEEKETEIRGT